MKKISLSFLVMLVGLFLASFSCQDHTLPTPPSLVTLPLQHVQTARVSGDEPFLVPIVFNLRFAFLGTIDIVEYGIVYSASPPQEETTDDPRIGDPNVATVVFNDPAAVGDIDEFEQIQSYYLIHYRAYAKLSNGEIVYANVLSEEFD